MKKSKIKGFSLIEMLLVMTIVAVILVTSITFVTQRTENLRIERTALQVQAILNAALAFYVANGRWPEVTDDTALTTGSNTTELQRQGYLPAEPMLSPFGTAFAMGHYSTAINPFVQPEWFTVNVGTPIGTRDSAKMSAIAKQIAGKLPFGATELNISWIDIFASVPPPDQSVGASSAINFGGLYHHGGCVPVPDCTSATPTGTTMTPEIYVMPISVSGVSDQSSSDVYPISSFTAFASGAPDVNPPACPGGTQAACAPITGNASGTGLYWRVCMQVITEKGSVADTRTDDWGNLVTLGAFTRCSPANEPEGTGFDVFTH